MTETRFRCWSAGGQRVDCELSVLDQLSSAAWDGFRRFRHGGMEVGGILIGSFADQSVRVLNARPMEISYGRGAIFRLTDADYESLDSLIHRTDKELAQQGLQVIGYYESHNRRDALLEESDLETYDVRFHQPSRVCIVLKPDKENGTIVNVYVRDQRGEIIRTELEGDFIREEEEAPEPVTVAVATPPPPVAQAIQVPLRQPTPAITAPAPPPIATFPAQHIRTAPVGKPLPSGWTYVISWFDRVVAAATAWIGSLRVKRRETPASPPKPVSQQVTKPDTKPTAPAPAVDTKTATASPQNPPASASAKNKHAKTTRGRRKNRKQAR